MYNRGIEIAVHGTPIPNGCIANRSYTMPRKYTPQERIDAFWNKVNKDGAIHPYNPELGKCWEWIGAHHRQGYGSFGIDGKTLLAHRVSWLYTYGKLLDDLCILHSCDNTNCVRPSHLFIGTQLINVQDKVNKGRQAKITGEKHPSCTISDVQVEAIRQRYAEGGATYKEIAKEFGISFSTVGRFVTKKHTKR